MMLATWLAAVFS